MFLADCALQQSLPAYPLMPGPWIRLQEGRGKKPAAPGGEDGQKSRQTKNQQTVFIGLLRLELNPAAGHMDIMLAGSKTECRII